MGYEALSFSATTLCILYIIRFRRTQLPVSSRGRPLGVAMNANATYVLNIVVLILSFFAVYLISSEKLYKAVLCCVGIAFFASLNIITFLF